MKHKYKTFEDYFNELENYSMRSDRFHEEFQALDYIKRTRMIEWLKAAFECAREKESK